MREPRVAFWRGMRWRSGPPAVPDSVTVLLLARIPAWLIALFVVLVDARPPENLRYEPRLLVLAALELGVLIGYMLVRRRLLPALGMDPASMRDMLVVSALDIGFQFVILDLSGGLNTPYYHFAVMSLLLPAFLLGWPGSLSVLLGFEVAMMAIWSVSGRGFEGWTQRAQLGGAVPGLLFTPMLVVVVSQYMARLTRSLRAAAIERARLVAEEERARIAGEIHDGVAQFLYILQMGLDQQATVLSGDPVIGPRLRRLARLAQQALVEVRQYIFDLRPLLEESASLEQTVRSQAREFRAVAEIPLTVQMDGPEPRLSTAIRGALFRVMQEALANVYRHADASRIAILIRSEPGRLVLEVSDDGSGFASPLDLTSSGRGMENMRRRLAEVGGLFEVITAPGTGTTVRATVPAEAFNAASD